MHGELVDGVRLITDDDYLNIKFKNIVLRLLKQVQVQGRVPYGKFEFTPPEPRSVDNVPERLLSNLFPVKWYPPIIFSAPTTVQRDLIVFKKLGGGIPPFILKRGKIYTFDDLSDQDSNFSSIIDQTKVTGENVSQWIQDSEWRNDLIYLFNLALRRYCLERDMKYEKRHRRFVCLLRNGGDRYFSWKSGSRRSRRAVAKLVRGQDGKLLYCRHYAASLRFMFIGDRIFLKIEPTITFTHDGESPIRSSRLTTLMSRWLPRQYNNAYLSLVRFWAKYLSRLDITLSVPVGEKNVDIDANPMYTRMVVGIKEEGS